MTETLEKDFKLVIKEIKDDIRKTQARVIYKANNELMLFYFRIGKILEENSIYGNGFIKNIAL